MRGRFFLLGFAVAAWTASAAAQSPPPLVIQNAPPGQPPIDLSIPPGTASMPLGPLSVGGLFQPGTAADVGGFGSTWHASATAAFNAPGGVHVSASLIGRRGYDAPLFMATAAGHDPVVAAAAVPLVTTARAPVLWDTRLRVERSLRSGRRLQIDAFGEAFNLLNVNPSSANVSGTLTSRTFRIGLVLGF